MLAAVNIYGLKLQLYSITGIKTKPADSGTVLSLLAGLYKYHYTCDSNPRVRREFIPFLWLFSVTPYLLARSTIVLRFPIKSARLGNPKAACSTCCCRPSVPA